MTAPFHFEVQAADRATGARAGLLHTPHGPVETPVFMPVGTQATVKAMSPADLEACGARVILANAYHLHLRPGSELVRDAGGLHRFEGWKRAILTDSGGYQVFSLKQIATVTDDGVQFQSHIDGSRHCLSPERMMEIEHDLGADIIMAFDQCPASSAPEPAIAEAVERTIGWARRCADAHARTPFHHGYPQALFAVVQGGALDTLRQRCARELVALDCPGYAIGGLAVGEPNEEMYRVTELTTAMLPADRPRYLMGVGTPQDILECIARGVDMFDCVLPTRNGRNGSVFTWSGRLNLRNAGFARQFDRPIDERCGCAVCRAFSRAYLRHLTAAGEILGLHLLTYHNVAFFLDLVGQARSRIRDGTFAEWKRDALARLGPVGGSDGGGEENAAATTPD